MNFAEILTRLHQIESMTKKYEVDNHQGNSVKLRNRKQTSKIPLSKSRPRLTRIFSKLSAKNMVFLFIHSRHNKNF